MKKLKGINTDSVVENLPEVNYRYAPNVTPTECDNQRIADFMGKTRQDYPLLQHLNNHQYHSSWDFLMPVIEKICRLKIGDGQTYVDYATPRTFGMLNEQDGQIMVRLNGYFLHQADTLIEAAYAAVVEFVRYYAETEKSTEPK